MVCNYSSKTTTTNKQNPNIPWFWVQYQCFFSLLIWKSPDSQVTKVERSDFGMHSLNSCQLPCQTHSHSLQYKWYH